MWLAICAKHQCRWDHVASSRTSADVYATGHYLDCFRELHHRVFVVDIPDELPLPDPRPLAPTASHDA